MEWYQIIGMIICFGVPAACFLFIKDDHEF